MWSDLVIILVALVFAVVLIRDVYRSRTDERSWRGLAKRFPGPAESPYGAHVGGGSIGNTRASGTLLIAATPDGLYVGCSLSWFAPPILVPWDQVGAPSVPGLAGRCTVRLGEARLEVSNALWHEVMASYDPAWSTRE